MQTMRPKYLIELLVVGLLSSAGYVSRGQIPTDPISYVPVVTIRATDPQAGWNGNPGVFTVIRSGNPQPSLNIYYQIGGTASNGWDYAPIGSFVQIPSGVMSGNIVIKPLNQGQTTDKTVELTLAPSPLMGPLMPVNYMIGFPSNATVVISAKPLTNVPPLVNVVFPTNGAVFFTPVKLPLTACAYDPDGFVKQVEFFANGSSLGVVTNSPYVLPATPGVMGPLPPLPPYRPFVFTWTNVPPTNVVLTAVATDNSGASTVSDPVSFSVRQGPPPPPPPQTNLVVRLTSPADGAIFRAPLNLPIYAYAADLVSFAAGSGASVTGVEFFAGTTDLGPGQRVTSPVVAGTVMPSPILLSNLWRFVWTNAPQGTFALTAVATDTRGVRARSDAVNVAILPPPLPPPTPTNVVSIIAADPIAIEGTNCWPWLGLASAVPTWTNWTASSAVCRYFTNCGPKNALFIVHCFGPTNDDLAVGYGIGGTATNGVDYVTLPGSVTIPAGQHSALITVVPLDDGPPDITSTVILKLKPGTDYVIGRPASAAAIILDGLTPQPLSGMLPDKTFRVATSGPNGAWVRVESTADLLHWTPVCTNQVIQGTINFIDPEAPANQVRFYRAVPEASAP
jgi:hypothetical protein